MKLGLSLEELQGELARFSYRPGWRFVVWEHPFEGPYVSIQARVEDSYHRGEEVDLNIHSPLPPMTELSQVGTWLMWRLQIIESHECREWLRRDGVHVSDPHEDPHHFYPPML